MIEKIKDNISKNNLLNQDDSVIVGFSGGADSTLLVYVLKKLNYKVYAVHIHHGIRGEEADRDSLFAHNFCKKINVPFFEEKIDIPTLAKEYNLSLETCARQERYKIFNSYAEKFNAIIAVAHNKNDQAETVFMHLLRGSGLNGLCGMQFKTQNIIRPLLNITREEIEKFNYENKLEYITDSTNLSCEYTRNKLRLNILPAINDAFGIDAVSSISKCADTLNDFNLFIKEVVDFYSKSHITKENKNIILKIDDVPKIIYIELIKKSIELLKGDIVDVEKIHLESVFELTKKESGKEVHLPYSIKAKKVYDKIFFSFSDESFFATYSFQTDKYYNWNNYTINSCLVEEYIKDSQCEYLDFDNLPSNVTLRTRLEGDYIYPLGSSGKCTLKKYFIDKKIPSNIRNELPLIAKDNEIFAILGYTVSDKVKITSSTKRILKISWTK